MKAAVLIGFGKPLETKDVEYPKLEDKEGVIIKIAATGVCHSDVHVAFGDWSDFLDIKLPTILGHECSGYVEEIGENVKGFEKGDAVLVYNCFGCGFCEYCRKGEENLCPNLEIPGLGKYQGGYAEYMYVPHYRHLLKVDEDPVTLTPIADAGITAYRALKKARNYMNAGDYVLIFGMGGLGFLGLQIAKLMGSSYIIVGDIREDKLAIAERLGADFAIDTSDIERAEKEIKDITKGKGIKVAIDFVGTNATLELARKVLSNGSRLILVGLAGGNLHMPISNIVSSELEIQGSVIGSFNELVEVYNLYKTGKLRISEFMKKKGLEDINEVFEDIRNYRAAVKTIIIP